MNKVISSFNTGRLVPLVMIILFRLVMAIMLVLLYGYSTVNMPVLTSLVEGFCVGCMIGRFVSKLM